MKRSACIFVYLLALLPVAVCAAGDVLDDTTAIAGDSAPASLKSVQPPAAQPVPGKPAAIEKPSAPAKPAASVKADSGSALFEGGEESLFEDDAAAKKQKTEPAVKPDSTKKPGAAAVIAADSVRQPSAPVTDTGAAARHEEAVQAPHPAGKDTIPKAAVERVKVEEVKSINFARNLKDYRSPQLAMLFSLVLPGAGQAYAGNYVKTAIFGVLEVAIIGASVAYQVQGKTENIKAKHFADQHFSGTKFNAYYDSLYNFFHAREAADNTLSPAQVDSAAQADMDDIFYPTQANTSYKTTFSNQVASHASDYYDAIQLKSLVQGWDDCTPTFAEILAQGAGTTFTGSSGGTYTVHASSTPDSSYLVVRGTLSTDSGGLADYGFSDNQTSFANWVSKANGYYRTGFGILYVLLLNHIASAIDAGITAKQHNDRLLGKQSYWQQIHLDPICINTGSGVAAGCALQVTF